MPVTLTPRWLEWLVRISLGAEPQDSRLGDLSEQYMRTLELGAVGTSEGALSRIMASLHYAGAAAVVVVFARVIDPSQRLVENGTLGLMVFEMREKLMNAMRRLAIPAVLLACSAFLVFSAVAVWQDWRQNEAMLQTQQRDKAEALVQRIDAFIGDIQRQVGWVAQAQWASLPVDQRRFDYVRMLRQVSPISELVYIDRDGREQLHVSRLSMDKIGEGTDRSSEPVFSETKSGKTYFSPMYLRRNSEPYLTLGVSHGARTGVTAVVLNMKPILDVVADAKVGRSGYAYIVDGQGHLIAHPDVALVVRGTDMKALPQVAAALAATGDDKLMDGKNRRDAEVWSAHSSVKTLGLGWHAFVELPVAEIRSAFWMAMARAAGLLALGLAAAWFAFRLGMRTASPIQPARA